MSQLKVACLQMEVARGGADANLEKVAGFVREAKRRGARLLLLPEMWSGGFAYLEMPRLAERTPGILEELGRLGREHDLAIAGSLPEAGGGRLYNTFYAVDTDGTVKGHYRKIHLFPGFKEDVFMERGARPVNIPLLGMNLGLAICFDLRFPELFRKLALKGAHIILVSAQWPRERLDHWRVLNAARAVENQVFIAAANSSGRDGKVSFAGHSMIIHPSGEVLAEAGEAEELITATLDTGDVEKARAGVNFLSCRVKEADEFLTLL